MPLVATLSLSLWVGGYDDLDGGDSRHPPFLDGCDGYDGSTRVPSPYSMPNPPRPPADSTVSKELRRISRGIPTIRWSAGLVGAGSDSEVFLVRFEARLWLATVSFARARLARAWPAPAPGWARRPGTSAAAAFLWAGRRGRSACAAPARGASVTRPTQQSGCE